MSDCTIWHVYSLFFFIHSNRDSISPSCPSKEIHFISVLFFYFLWLCRPTRATAFLFSNFLGHTRRRPTVGSIPLDEWSARRRDLYLTTHRTQQKDIRFPGGVRTHNLSRRAAALDRVATGTGNFCGYWSEICWDGDRICQTAENERNITGVVFFYLRPVTIIFRDQQKGALSLNKKVVKFCRHKKVECCSGGLGVRLNIEMSIEGQIVASTL